MTIATAQGASTARMLAAPKPGPAAQAGAGPAASAAGAAAAGFAAAGWPWPAGRRRWPAPRCRLGAPGPARGPAPGSPPPPAAPSGSCCWGRCPGRRRSRSPRSAPSPPGRAPIVARTVRRSSPGRPPPAVSRPAPIDRQRDHREQVHREPVRRGERREAADPTGQKCGCGVAAMDRTMPVSVPRLAVQRALPEAASRPGLQHGHAEEEQAQGRPAPSGPAAVPASCARAARSARRRRSRTPPRPGAPNSQVRPGAKIPPNASPNTQTTRPQPALASPASLDHGRAARRSARPRSRSGSRPPRRRPGSGGTTSWCPAQFTMCWTQPGELAAAGSMTWEGSPAAMAGCACSRPSKIQMMPKPIRSSCRQAGSAAALPRARRRNGRRPAATPGSRPRPPPAPRRRPAR